MGALSRACCLIMLLCLIQFYFYIPQAFKNIFESQEFRAKPPVDDDILN